MVKADDRTVLLWNLNTDDQGIEDTNMLLTLFGEITVKNFNIGYVNTGNGDGLSMIFGGLNSILQERNDEAGYDTALRIDQRGPSVPQLIDAAVARFRLR